MSGGRVLSGCGFHPSGDPGPWSCCTRTVRSAPCGRCRGRSVSWRSPAGRRATASPSGWGAGPPASCTSPPTERRARSGPFRGDRAGSPTGCFATAEAFVQARSGSRGVPAIVSVSADGVPGPATMLTTQAGSAYGTSRRRHGRVHGGGDCQLRGRSWLGGRDQGWERDGHHLLDQCRRFPERVAALRGGPSGRRSLPE